MIEAPVKRLIKPELSSPFPKPVGIWTDSITGIKVPKEPQRNIEWRSRWLKEAEKDVSLQLDLLAACKSSQLFWFNAFAWTYHQNEVDGTGKIVPAKHAHHPFITWEIQDQLVSEIVKAALDGRDLGIKKSRQMGASWLCAGVLHWFWLFRPESRMLEMSRVQDYVDQRGNMKALFQKHDYINRFLPDWMRPPSCMPGQKNRTKMHMENKSNGSVIDGESTTEHAGSGDSRFIILLDEFAKVENGQAMRSATADVSPCRVVNSTPAGAGTEYSKWLNSGQIKVFVLPFWEHPQKGRGRYVRETDTGKYEIRSPWFDYESKRRSKKELAQEILMQDIESGDVFFDLHNVEVHKSLYARPARATFEIGIKDKISNAMIGSKIKQKDKEIYWIARKKNGSLKVWAELKDKRLDQNKSYIFGIDLGKGQGASNSVVSIKCIEDNEKIAEWANANVPPYEMARVVVALALWVGGRPPKKLPFIKWESNGPGWDFGRMIVQRFRYPYFYRSTESGKIRNKESKKYGWHASQQAKYELLDQYNTKIANGEYINHSEMALNEMYYYIHYPNKQVGPAELIKESSSARLTHGDRVIADALTIDTKQPKRVIPEMEYPENSMGYRKEQLFKKRKQPKKIGWRHTFNYNKG